MSNEVKQRRAQRGAAAGSGTLTLGPLNGRAWPSSSRPMHPILFHLGHFTVPTFGVLAAVGLVCALLLSFHTATLAGLNPEALWDAGFFTVLSALILSRLLLVIANFKSFLSYPLLILALPSLTATGLLLTLIAAFIYLKMRRLSLLRALDAWAPALRSHGRSSRSGTSPKAAIPACLPPQPGASCRPPAEPACTPWRFTPR